MITEDDDGDVDRAENTELVRLFEQAVLALFGGKRKGGRGRGGTRIIKAKA